MRNTVFALAFTLAFLSAPLRAQVPLPDTPAGRVLAGWLEAFNSGNPDRLRAYYDIHVPSLSAEPVIPYMSTSGGLDVVDVPSSERLSLEFVLKERASETRGMGKLVVEEAEPHRVLSFPFSAIPPGTTPIGFTIDAEMRQEVIEGASAALEQFYVFPDKAEEMAEALQQRRRRGEYDAVTDGAEFARLLTEHLREVSNDLHLRVDFSPAANPPPLASAAPNPTASELYREQMVRVNCGFEKIEILPGNAGYLKFNMFSDPAICGPTATAAMNFLQHVDALIVDMRDNGGGTPAMVAYVTSYLFDTPTHLNDLYNRAEGTTRQWWTLPHVPGERLAEAPVYVLTSQRTFSAAEEFTYNLKSLGRATIVGEATGGGAHPVRGERINEQFSIGVPFARAINPITKTNWEGTGVEPDVAIPAAEALEKALEVLAAASQAQASR